MTKQFIGTSNPSQPEQNREVVVLIAGKMARHAMFADVPGLADELTASLARRLKSKQKH